MLLKQIKIIQKLELTPINDTYWSLAAPFGVDFVTDEGIWRLKNQPQWVTDLRSGSDIINSVVPKWGNDLYTAGILMHDTAFSGWMSFKLANEMLYQSMVLSKQVGSFRAGMARFALDHFGESHYCDMDTKLKPPYGRNRELESLVLVDK